MTLRIRQPSHALGFLQFKSLRPRSRKYLLAVAAVPARIERYAYGARGTVWAEFLPFGWALVHPEQRIAGRVRWWVLVLQIHGASRQVLMFRSAEVAQRQAGVIVTRALVRAGLLRRLA
jgi:hypothetical protein